MTRWLRRVLGVDRREAQLAALDDRLAVLARLLDRELTELPDRVVLRVREGDRGAWR